MRYFLIFLLNLVTKRWNILLLIVIFVTIPLLFIQYAMIKEQSDTLQNWFLFDDRNIINDLKNRNSQYRINNRLERPADYCNLPLTKFHEGEKSLGRKWKLKYVFVFLRHGQRTTVNTMKGASYQYKINCSLVQFLSFKIHDWTEFTNSFGQYKMHFADYDMKGICAESQLTLMGILQMFILGSRLKKAYNQFLDSNSPLIYSTPYQRTVLSAEIIHYQLMKDAKTTQNNANIIESQSLVFCGPDFNISCQCPSLRFFYSKYNRYKSNINIKNVKCNSLINKFNNIFLSNQHSINSLTTLFDIVSSALCASNLDEISKSNLFCWPMKGKVLNQEPWSFLYKSVDGSEFEEPETFSKNKDDNNLDKRCIPLNLLVDLWNCVDSTTEQINNFMYFRKYSKLAVFPILNNLVSKISSESLKSTERNKKNEDHKKFNNMIIYVGHDHTLRHLLSALDFKRSMKKSIYNVINVWPGFASRLSIEIFESTVQDSLDDPLQFRLLYNGLNITSALMFCPSHKPACDFNLLKDYLYSKGFWNENMFSTTEYSSECSTV